MVGGRSRGLFLHPGRQQVTGRNGHIRRSPASGLRVTHVDDGDRVLVPRFVPSPWEDPRFVRGKHLIHAQITVPELQPHMSKSIAAVLQRCTDWLLDVTIDVFPPAPEGNWEEIKQLRSQIPLPKWFELVSGRERWVVFRPAAPTPYIERIMERGGAVKVLSTDVRELPVQISKRDWAIVYQGFYLLGATQTAIDGGGRPRGKRTGLDHQTWLEKTRELRRLTRHAGVSVGLAVERLELNLSDRQARAWIADLDEREPEEFPAS
jgi:hypothetical protein